MGKDLKENWKETGKALGYAFRDLGKTLIKTGAFALQKADEWANGDEKKTSEEKKNEDCAGESKTES